MSKYLFAPNLQTPNMFERVLIFVRSPDNQKEHQAELWLSPAGIEVEFWEDDTEDNSEQEPNFEGPGECTTICWGKPKKMAMELRDLLELGYLCKI